ncbi:MAG: SDR family NAD(P)-dependent oxidoreductase, partial [Desulfocucumaceae bacterium]
MQLSKKVATVTGGGGGFGREISLTLARAGALLAVVDKDLVKAEEVARQVQALGSDAAAFELDISKVDQIKAVVEKVIGKFGGVDILINNAGVTLGKPVVEVTEDDWTRIMDVNFKGPFFMAQAAGQEMIKRGGGNIVNISSVNAFIAEINTAVYSASKAGLINLTRSLAREWAKYNVRVNAVAPGYARTPLTEFLMEKEKMVNSLLKRIPLRRLCTAGDVAQAVLYLVSDVSSFVTGQVIVVD